MLNKALTLIIISLLILGCTQTPPVQNNLNKTTVDNRSNPQNNTQNPINQVNNSITSNNNSGFNCLPQDVHLSDIVEVHLITPNNPVNSNKTTIEQRLNQLSASCNNGKLIDGNNKEIKFYKLAGCWGNPPPNYREIMAKQQKEIQELQQNYNVITITCNPTGIPYPGANTDNKSFSNLQGNSLPSCDSNNTFFTTSPLTSSDLTGIVPLGNPNPPAHIFPTDHIYLYIKRSGPATQPGALPPAAEVPVVSPGAITILQINSKYYLSSTMLPNFKPHTDYLIQFSPCNELSVRFDHLATLSDNIKSQYTESSDYCTTYTVGGTTIKSCRSNVMIKLKAGEAIGTAGGPDGSNALDFGTYDSRITQHSYANPSRWGPNSIYAVCPLDYYIPDLRDKLKALLGSYDGKTLRTTEPVCGEVAQDKNGTAQGAWFVKRAIPIYGEGKSQTYSEDPNLALVHGNVDPSKGVFSVGSSTGSSGLMPDAYSFDPANSGFVNRDFKDVVADGTVYCYNTKPRFYTNQSGSKVILIQMINDTALRIEKQNATDCGSGPWSFSNTYTDFER